MASRAQLHAELIGFLRQHCPVRDRRHLVLLGWMVVGLLLSETVCFDRWKTRLPLAHCLAASWQRRCQRWLANGRIDVEVLYGPLVLWAIQQWQNPGHTLHLALDTTMLWNRFCVVVVSVVVHGRAIPLLWQTLEHPSASVSASVSIALLEKADQLLAGFESITLLADRAFPCDAVNIGRLIAHHPVVVAARIEPADVITPDDEDIGFVLGMSYGKSQTQHEGSHDYKT